MNAGGCPRDADSALNWVLGTLEAGDAERFRRPLAACPLCRADVNRFQHVLDALAEAPASVQPPSAIRDRLIEVAREEAAMSRALDALETEPDRRTPRRRPLALAAAAGMLLLAVAVAGLTVRSGGADDRPSPRRTLVGTVSEDGGAPRARAALVMRGAAAELVLTDLAGPPRGRVYQAWVVRPPAAPIATGALFSVPRGGQARVRVPDVRGAERVIVTAEPPRGSRVPTPPPRVTVLIPR